MSKVVQVPVIGARYRDWEVICDKRYKCSTNRATYWKVRCKCGFEALRAATHLIKNKVGACKSCCKKKNSFIQNYFNRVVDRAKTINVDLDITVDYILDILTKQEYKCNLSKLPIEIRKHWYGKVSQTASLDRIDNTKGYIKGNVQWLHKDINNMKYTFTEEYFIDLCRRVANNN